LPVPFSYKECVLRFGNAKLYRRLDYYLVEVYAGPRQAVSATGESLIHFGRTHTALAYFKEALLVEGKESPVFVWRHGRGLQKAADGFEEWLQSACAAARRKYKSREWEAIVKGPPPFSDRERAIVEARRRYRWRVVGIAPNGDLRFEVHNGSDMILPYLSLGVRGELRPPQSGPLHGGARLPVAAIPSHTTLVVEYDCYKQFMAPEHVEVFDLPDPGPEDREQYWEFKGQ
jgi:hypothetical protein